MAKSIETLCSFNAGEFSPTLTSRVDQAKYLAACKRLRNMVCLKTGAATRRPGSQFRSATKNSSNPSLVARMSEFLFSTETTFALEWGQNYVRFYSNGEQVNVTSAAIWNSGVDWHRNDYAEDPDDGLAIFRCIADVSGGVAPHLDSVHWARTTILELWTPYDADKDAVGGDIRETQVFQLAFAELNDVIYVVHKSHPRWKLTRVTDEHWTFSEVVELTPPLRDQNATNVKISSTATQGPTTLTASAPTWSPATYYEAGDVVNFGAPLTFYKAVVPHVSSASFSDDLTAGIWEVFKVLLPGHVGSYWELANLRPSAAVEYDGVAATGFAAGESNTITIYGDWEVRTYGVWNGRIQVKGSFDGGNSWQVLRSVTGRDDRNLNIEGTADRATLMKIVVDDVNVPVTPGATDPRVVLEAVDGFLFGIVKITAVATAYQATAEVITQLPTANAWVSGSNYFVGDRVSFDAINYVCIVDVSGSTTDPATDTTSWQADGWPTEYWSEGAWSEVRGYPRAIASFQQRVWCGFTDSEPLRIWGTKLGENQNWDLGTQENADDGLAFDLDATGDGTGVWLAGQDALFAGVASSEWVVQPSDATQALGPTSITAHRQSRWGSNPNVAARTVGDALVFVDRQGFTVRQMLFSVFSGKYMSQDLTALCDRVMNFGAIQLAYQRQGQKNGVLWATTVDGELAGMTYDLDQEVFGWHRHTTGESGDNKDSFESVAVLPGRGLDDDEVWLVVSRSGGRYVERLNPVNWTQSQTAVKTQSGWPAEKGLAFYVDAGVSYENPTSNVFTGLAHLNGRRVAAAIDGVDYGLFTVAGGKITVDEFTPPTYPTEPSTWAHVGLPFQSLVEPLNIDLDARTGVTKGLQKKVAKIVPTFWNTLACMYSNGGSGAGDTLPIDFTDQANPGDPPELFTGDKEIRDFPGAIGLEVPVILFTDGPLPLTVLSLTMSYGITGTP